MTAESLSRLNGETPVRHSNATHASEYWSERPSTGFASICSGLA
jgi:hypothetical protein